MDLKGEIKATVTRGIRSTGNQDDENEWVRVLRRACLRGKRAIRRNYTEGSRHHVLSRGAGGDLTLEIDKLSETAILQSLDDDLGKDEFVFFSEEMGERKSEAADFPKPVVICDPLDGSHNAKVGLPIFSISLSVLLNSRRVGRAFRDVRVAFTQSVQTQDEYYAVRGSGAFHNGKKLKVAPRFSKDGPDKKFATLGVECGDIDYAKRALGQFTSSEVYKFRLLGSAALSFCFVAEGTYDGFLFLNPDGARSIDSAGGYLIARESGCYLSNLSAPSTKLEDALISFDSRLNVAVARSNSELEKLVNLVGQGLSPT